MNGWSTQNEKLYNDLSIDERHMLNKAMMLELERTIPYYRKSFKQLYFITLKRRPDELFTDRRVSEMQIQLLEDEFSKLKRVLKIK